jgi:hypothetical protein
VQRMRSLTSWILWLSTALFLALFVLTVTQNEIVAAFGWLSPVLGAALTASGATERWPILSYVAVGSFVVDILITDWRAFFAFR